MGFPNLLYKTGPHLPKIDLAVFEDLQLLNFIPSYIAKEVASPCDEGDIYARRQLMTALEDAQNRSKLEALIDAVSLVCEYDERLTDSRCENERNSVFLSLTNAVLKFAALAADFNCGGALGQRFSEYFSELLKKASVSGLSEDVSRTLPLTEAFSRGAFTLHDRSLTIRTGSGVTYTERMEKCARDLGLDELDRELFAPRQFSPAVINAVAKLHPAEFEAFSDFYKKHAGFYDAAITNYKVQLEYYRTMLALFDRVKAAGIPLSYPEIAKDREIRITNAYDVSLLAKNEKNIVPNDITFTKDEPFFYLTGANGGGKTTYLRTVGIALLLFVNGCPVPCEGGSICTIDCIYTHFPRDERFDGTGRFVEELNRTNKIREAMTENSVVLLNETYSSTSEENAVVHTVELAEELYGRGIFGLYITHQHGIGKTEIPYLNVIIDRDDANRRTFKIAHRKNIGGSFASDILEKYALTREALERRFAGGYDEIQSAE